MDKTIKVGRGDSSYSILIHEGNTMDTRYKLKQYYPCLPEEFRTGTHYAKPYQGEYIMRSKRGFLNLSADDVENNPEFWEKVDDRRFIVTKIKFKHGIGTYNMWGQCIHRDDDSNPCDTVDLDFALETIKKEQLPWKIWAVKSTSNGQEFTVGDIVTYDYSFLDQRQWKIGSFEIRESGAMIAHSEDGTAFCAIDRKNFRHVPFMFHSDDGEGIYEGDPFHYISHGWLLCSDIAKEGKTHDIARARFADKDKAIEWIELNKPFFSKRDIRDFIYEKGTATPYNMSEEHRQEMTMKVLTQIEEFKDENRSN